jgi:hypothetical protein
MPLALESSHEENPDAGKLLAARRLIGVNLIVHVIAVSLESFV